MPILRKYATATTIDGVTLRQRGFPDFKANPTFAAGDVKVSKNGGAFANLTTLPTVTPASGEFVQVSLSGTEMTAAHVCVKFVDQASPKEWEDREINIETYGHASAEHAFDLDAASTAQTGDSFARLGAPAGASVSADVAAVKADTADIETRIPSVLVGGRIDASVGAMAADVVTASAIATDAIGAAELAADAVAEIAAAVGGGGGGGGAWSIMAVMRSRVERPPSGTLAEPIHAFVESAVGTPVNADATPAAAATGTGGVNLDANLGAITNPDTGHYVIPYNVSTTHGQPLGVVVLIAVTLGGVTKRIAVAFDVVNINNAMNTVTSTGVNVFRVQGTTLSGKTGANFQAFFNNNGSDTTKIVQDTGGTASINVTLGAIMAVAASGNRVAAPLLLEMFQGAEQTFSFTITDANGQPVSQAGKTLRFEVFDSSVPTVGVFEVEGADITVTGVDSNVINVKVQPSKSASASSELHWVLWDVTNPGHESQLAWGHLKILPAVKDI